MLRPGEVVHYYSVIAQRGNGNFGYVFEVEDTNDNERLALKLLTNTSGDNDTRFRAENGHLYTLLGHSNIIEPKTKVLDVSGRTFYCMELADTSVEPYIATSPLSNQEALNLFSDICGAMKHAHEKRIVHRDLHLGNVLLMVGRPEGISPKLTDFGRAKDFNASTLSYIPATVWGKIPTWAPEIFFLIWQDAQIDKYILADIYSLGMILHDLLAPQSVPYISGLINSIATYLHRNGIAGNAGIQINTSLAANGREQHYQTWLQQYDHSNQANLNVILREPNVELEKAVNQIIQKCCAPDYNDRYMSVEVLIQDVRALC